jgi:hypothetical protein
MALTALALVAPGDTITAAQQNIVRTNFGVLDARTGGDPGSSGLLAVSNGAASVAWTDDLVAVLAALGYTPANKAGDTFTGSILATGDIAAVGNLSGATLSATGQVTAGQYAGGTTSAGSPQVKGLTVGTDGIVTTGTISPAAYVGGSTATGTPNVKGLNVGTDGIASTGVVNPAAYAGGTTGSGSPSVKGLTVGTDGLASSGPITVASQEVYWPGNPPPVSGGAGVPSGLIGAFETAAAIATGWARYTAANGRMLVGAGTVFSVTWTEATNYGAAWAHKHTGNSWPLTGHANGGPSDFTGASTTTLNGRFAAGGVNTLPDNHTMPLNGVSLALSGTADGDTSDASWVIPSRAVVWAQKT